MDQLGLWSSGRVLTRLPGAVPVLGRPGEPRPPPASAGSRSGCASRKLPAPRGPLPASAPPPRDPGRRKIGPDALSLSGRVTALVSDRQETGSAISARRGRGEGQYSAWFAGSRRQVGALAHLSRVPGPQSHRAVRVPPPAEMRSEMGSWRS